MAVFNHSYKDSTKKPFRPHLAKSSTCVLPQVPRTESSVEIAGLITGAEYQF